jgi:diguanylate cyclase (GGDEF)-like protein
LYQPRPCGLGWPEGGGGTSRPRASSETERGLLAELWEELRAPQDPYFEDAAASGERLVARIRFLLLGFILVIQLLPGWDPDVHRIGISMNTVGLAWAALMMVAVSQRYRRWMGLMSSLVDVTLVSMGLFAYLAVDRPHMAVNSRVIFEVYFLALGCASLRYDWRVCIVTGVAAVSQYLGLVLYAFSRYDFDDPRYAPLTYGTFTWNTQVARLVLLAAGAVLSTAIVLRAHRLRRLSTTDRLTGLPNRGLFEERLAEEASRAARHGRPLTLALLDIDHFKIFNDSYGHAGGDAALKALATVLRGLLRKSDVVARYGGEEFALILPETSAVEALEKMDALRRAVAETRLVPRRGAPAVGITVSIGVAGWPADGQTVADVLARADTRLYEAKTRGRNRVVGPPPGRSARLHEERGDLSSPGGDVGQ